jgi:hypothetical protein
MDDSIDLFSLKSRSAAVAARAIAPKIDDCFIKETVLLDYTAFVDAIKSVTNSVFSATFLSAFSHSPTLKTIL